jgi:hypothetical protein
MAKYVNKTQPTNISPTDYINNVENKTLIPDALELLKIFKEVTGYEPVMWGDQVGFGKYHYVTKSCDADWYLVGFVVRKSQITIYSMRGYKSIDELLAKLGKYKASGSCLHIKKLADIDIKVLKEIIAEGVEYMKKNYKVY